MRHSQISSRRQCLTTATADAREWAQTTDGEVYADLCRDLTYRSMGRLTVPDAESYAEALARHDGGFDDSPGSIAGVPQRWHALYDSTFERVYRAEIRARVAAILADDAEAA